MHCLLQPGRPLGGAAPQNDNAMRTLCVVITVVALLVFVTIGLGVYFGLRTGE